MGQFSDGGIFAMNGAGAVHVEQFERFESRLDLLAALKKSIPCAIHPEWFFIGKKLVQVG